MTAPSRSRSVRLPVLLVHLALGVAACGAPEPPPIVELTRGAEVDPSVTALVRSHVEEARRAPADAERRAALAMVYEANELWDEADRAWGAALALAPDRPLWTLHRAITARQAGHDERARALLEAVVARDPELAGARYRLGEALLEAGDLAGARRELEAAHARLPGHPDPLISLAEIASREDEPARAEELCRRALALAPDSRRAHYVLGLALRGQGRLDEAREALQRGLEAKRTWVPDPLTERIAGFRRGYTVRINEAAELERVGRTDEARRMLEQIVREHPEDVTALNNLAAVRIQTGDLEGALSLLERARALEPNQFATYVNRATAELALGLPEDSLSSATRAIEIARSVGRPYFVRARALIALERWREAYDDLVRATELDSGDFLTFAMLGDVALELGRNVEAVRAYEGALQRKADHLPARTRLVLAHERLGQRAQALRVFEDSRRIAPTHPDVLALARRLGLTPP